MEYPGCCCFSEYYADNKVNLCFARVPTSNCTSWALTE